MEYREDVALSNLHNVVVALNGGGALSCLDIASRIWDDSPQRVRDIKISKPRQEDRRTVEYALRQLRQEVRRTLHNYFNGGDESGFHIFKASPLNCVELFYVSEEQFVLDEDEDEIFFEDVLDDSIPGDDLPESFFEDLVASLEDGPLGQAQAAARNPVNLMEVLTPSEDMDTRIDGYLGGLMEANDTHHTTSYLLMDAFLRVTISGQNVSFVSSLMPDALCIKLNELIGDVIPEITEEALIELLGRLINKLVEMED